MKKQALLQKPIGIVLSVLGLLLFPMATIPLAAQELFNYCDDSPTPGVPGAQLAREARSDIYAHNYAAAMPLLEKGVRLGNEDCMSYLSFCYFYGHEVPLDRGKALQLTRTVYRAVYRREMQVDKEQQEERARSARAAIRAAENAESQSQSQSSTYRSTNTGPRILNPFPPPMNRPPFGTTQTYRVVPWGSTVGQGE